MVKVVRRCPRLHDIVKDDAYIYGILVVMNDSLDVGHLKNNNNPVIKKSFVYSPLRRVYFVVVYLVLHRASSCLNSSLLNISSILLVRHYL